MPPAPWASATPLRGPAVAHVYALPFGFTCSVQRAACSKQECIRYIETGIEAGYTSLECPGFEESAAGIAKPRKCRTILDQLTVISLGKARPPARPRPMLGVLTAVRRGGAAESTTAAGLSRAQAQPGFRHGSHHRKPDCAVRR